MQTTRCGRDSFKVPVDLCLSFAPKVILRNYSVNLTLRGTNNKPREGEEDLNTHFRALANAERTFTNENLLHPRAGVGGRYSEWGNGMCLRNRRLNSRILGVGQNTQTRHREKE